MKKKSGSTLTITLVVLVVLSILGITISGASGIVLRSELNRLSSTKVEMEFENYAYSIMNTMVTDDTYLDNTEHFPIVVKNSNGNDLTKTNPEDILEPVVATYYYEVEYISATIKTKGFVTLYFHREGRPKGCFYTFSYEVSSNPDYVLTYKLAKSGRMVW